MKKVKNMRGPGKPPTIKWNKANLVWKTKSNSEIARMLGCTSAAVCTKRKNLILAEKLKGDEGKPEKYQTKEGVRYRRNKVSEKGAETPAG